MLVMIKHMDELNISQLYRVYEESLIRSGRSEYSNQPENLQLILAEQDFHSYSRFFLKDDNSYYAIWTHEGVYKAALRLESYEDGVIITGLETAPGARREGHGANLVNAVLQFLSEKMIQKVYAHVSKDNIPSLQLHRNQGFLPVLDYAVYLDGSVSTNAYTLCRKIDKTT